MTISPITVVLGASPATAVSLDRGRPPLVSLLGTGILVDPLVGTLVSILVGTLVGTLVSLLVGPLVSRLVGPLASTLVGTLVDGTELE